MRLVKRLAALGTLALMVGAGMGFGAATAQAATPRNGVCEDGEFCYYYNSDQQGSVSDFTVSVGDYGTTQPSCYDFKGPGAGQGLCIKNDAASVWNRTTQTATVFFNSGYGGAAQSFAPGAKQNLNATLKNNNASHRIGGGTSPSGFLLPFPCGEVWEGATRTNHSPQNAVDFNHYPDDAGWMVYASKPGTVSVVGNLGDTSYGRYIVIDHGGGWQTLYAHLSAQNVSRGQYVTERTMIGRVGDTGNSFGAHLHYEQKLNGVLQKVTFVDGSPVYWGTTNLQRRTSCP